MLHFVGLSTGYTAQSTHVREWARRTRPLAEFGIYWVPLSLYCHNGYSESYLDRKLYFYLRELRLMSFHCTLNIMTQHLAIVLYRYIYTYTHISSCPRLGFVSVFCSIFSIISHNNNNNNINRFLLFVLIFLDLLTSVFPVGKLFT